MHLHLHTEYSLLDGAMKFNQNFIGCSVVRLFGCSGLGKLIMTWQYKKRLLL